MTACYCDYDYDGPSIHRVTNPKARKPHKCAECYRPILPGETYESFWGCMGRRGADLPHLLRLPGLEEMGRGARALCVLESVRQPA